MNIGLTIGLKIGAGRAPAAGDAPGGGTAHVATIAEFGADYRVFDSGAAFGRAAAAIPRSGTTDAPDGSAIEMRFVRADTGAAVAPWAAVATAQGGAWAGTYAGVPRGPHWLRAEARVAGSTAPAARTATRCAVGHVVALMGQSELNQTLHGGDSVAVPVADPQQIQLVRQDVTNAPGEAITGFSTDRAFLGAMSGHGYMTHAGQVIAGATGDKVMVIQLAISGTSRWYLSDDTGTLPTSRRRWIDHLATLDAAGWQDGVRPGVIVDMWTATDGRWGYDFARAFTPFYTGRRIDGSAYTLGEAIAARNIEEGGTNDIRHDHILYDLTGQGRGLYDPGETRLVICNHRHDNSNGIMATWLGRADQAFTDNYIWGQWDLRVRQREMLATPDFRQIAVMGPDPQNYQNGVDTGNDSWTDMLHPGAVVDGMGLFARHLAHAAVRGLGLAADRQPEIDGVTWAADGSAVTLRSSAGALTTTRKLRGEAELVSGVGTEHWTEFGGIAVNGRPVTSALPTGDGGIVVANPLPRPLDPARDRVSLGEVTMIDTQADPLNGWWKNYPVVDLGVPGLTGPNGVSVRPAFRDELADPAYLAALVPFAGAPYFLTGSNNGLFNPATPADQGALTTRLRLRLRLRADTNFTGVTLFSVGTRFTLRISPIRGLAVSTWRGQDVNSTGGLVLPSDVQDIVLVADFPGNAYRVWLDPADPDGDLTGVAPLLASDFGGFSNFVGSDPLSLLAGTDGGAGIGTGGFQIAQLYKNTTAADPARRVVDLQGAAGAAALNGHPLKRGAGSFG